MLPATALMGTLEKTVQSRRMKPPVSAVCVCVCAVCLEGFQVLVFTLSVRGCIHTCIISVGTSLYNSSPVRPPGFTLFTLNHLPKHSSLCMRDPVPTLPPERPNNCEGGSCPPLCTLTTVNGKDCDDVFGNGVCNVECATAACLQDGFDCRQVESKCPARYSWVG